MHRPRIRVLVAKPGLDGHDRGIKIVARALRDAGMDVIYLGIRRTPEQVVDAALQEDVDVIGISNLSAALVDICRRIRDGLHEKGVDEVLIVAGGTVLESDIEELRALGIRGVFGPGAGTDDIVEFIRRNVRSRVQAT